MAVNLLDFDLDGLTAWCESLGEKRFRAVQLFRWIHQKGAADFDTMSDLAKSLRAKLAGTAEIKALPVISEHVSGDGTIKWLFDVGGGDAVETVYIPEDDRGTLCVSSQIGCSLACTFCSTGTQGFNRNLSTSEIIGQVCSNGFSFPCCRMCVSDIDDSCVSHPFLASLFRTQQQQRPSMYCHCGDNYGNSLYVTRWRRTKCR